MEIGFANLAIRKTALSAAYSHNFHSAINGQYPNLSVDYSKMMISKGRLPGLISPQIELLEPGKLKISWENGNNKQTSYNDQLMLMLYCPTLHLASGFIGGIERAAKTALFTFDPRLQGQALEVYLSITSSNRKKIADSIYLGRIQS